MRQIVPIEQWPRREIYEFFSLLSHPNFSVTFRLDVTRLRACVRERGLSFYYCLTWLCTEAVNAVEAFHYGVEDGVLYRVDRRIPSFTDLHPGSEQFHIVTMDSLPTMEEFSREAGRISREQTDFIDFSRESADLIYISCLPWMDITGVTNARDLVGKGALDDSVPRLCWGKYTEKDGRYELGLSVEVNHRFADGFHVGQFAIKLNELIESLEINGGTDHDL